MFFQKSPFGDYPNDFLAGSAGVREAFVKRSGNQHQGQYTTLELTHWAEMLGGQMQSIVTKRNLQFLEG
jgi:hypothetical protein